MKRLHRGRAGFTLIELLVVVAILGIIAFIAIPSIARFMDRGTDEAAKTKLHNVQTAVIAAMADVEAGGLTAGHITNEPSNTVEYGDEGAILPIGEFILGGLTEVRYEYDVATDGGVTATTGPMSGSG